MKLLYAICDALACYVGWHHWEYWTIEVCQKRRIMFGPSPRSCLHCGHQSQVFFYPPCPPRPRPKIKDHLTCRILEVIASHTPFSLSKIELAYERLGSCDATMLATDLACKQNLSLGEAVDRIARKP